MPESVPLPLRGELANLRQLERQLNQFSKRASKNLKIDFTGTGKNLESLSQPLGRITGKADEFTKSMEAANARVIAFGASVGILGAVTQSFKALVSTTIEVEKSLAKINSILNTNTAGLEKITKQIFDIAKNTEQTFDTVANAALELSRQGLSATEVTKRLNDSLILARLSGVDAAEAVGSLTAAVNGFSKSGLTTGEILNKVSAAANKFAVSERDLFEAFKRSASVAQQAGVSIDELGGIITAVQQRTARGGAVIGNSFKTIFTRIGRADNLALLESLGVQITDVQGAILPATRLIENLAKKLEDLDDVKVRAVSEKIGGGFQIAPLLAALQDYSDENSVAIAATEAFANATDEAYKKNIALNQTLSAAIQSTSLSVKELANTLGELGVQDIFRTLLTSIQGVVDGITGILQGDGIASTFARGFVKGVSGLILPALGLVLVIVAKLSKDLIKFGVDSLKTFLGLGNAAERLKNVESQTFKILVNNEAVRKQILAIENASISAEQKKVLQSKLFTDSLLQQKTILQELQQISARVAPGIIAGTNRGSQRVGRSAGGFLPVGAEKSDISRGVGGAPRSARPVVIPNFAFGGGKKGTMVANSSEYIVPNFAGGGSAIFNQNMVKSMGLPRGAKKINAASGFIPNFARFPFGKARGTDFQRASGVIKEGVGGTYGGQVVTQRDVETAGLFIKNNPSAQQRAKGPGLTYNTYDANDAPSAAVMIVPDQLGLSPNATNLKYRKQKKYVTFNSKRSRVNQFIGGAAGINPNLNENSKFASLLDLDEKLDENLANAANATLFDFQTLVKGGFKTNPVSYSAKEIKNVFLKEGGAGALSAFKGAIFEGLINAITGGVETDQDSTLDIAFGKGKERQVLEEIFGLTPGKFEFGDFKASLSDGNKEKYRNQILKNLPKALEKRALTKAELAGQASKGYIPNYAMSALDEAIEREKAAGIPVNQIRLNQSGKLRNSKNPDGLAVTNTRDEPTGRIPQNAARGFVPNYNIAKSQAERQGKGVEGDNLKDIKDSGADASAKLFALSTAAFALQGAFGGIADETEGVGKTLAEFSQGVTQATTTLLLLQGLGVKLGPGSGILKSLGPSKGTGKLVGNLTKFQKILRPLGTIFGFLGKRALALVPGIGQIVVGFQILSPLVKALSEKFKPFGDAIDAVKDVLLRFASLLPFIDTPEQRAAKQGAEVVNKELKTALSTEQGQFSLAREAAKNAAIKAKGVTGIEDGSTEEQRREALLKQSASIIEKSLEDLAKKTIGGGEKNAFERNEFVRSRQFLIQQISADRKQRLIESPQDVGSFVNVERGKLGTEQKKELDLLNKQIANNKSLLASGKLSKKGEQDILKVLAKQEDQRADIFDSVKETAKKTEEQNRIEAESKGILKSIVNLRNEAQKTALKALIGREGELQFELKLQNALKGTSDLQKARNQRELKAIDQEKKRRSELLDVFDKLADASFKIGETAGGTKFKASEADELKNILDPFRQQIATSGTFDKGSLQKQLQASKTFKNDAESIAFEFEESLKIKNREIRALNAGKIIQAENLNLIKLAVKEEETRQRILETSLDLRTKELERQRDSAAIAREVEISRLRASAPGIRSESQEADLNRQILAIETAGKISDINNQFKLAQESAVKSSVALLRSEGINVTSEIQKGLRDALFGVKDEQGNVVSTGGRESFESKISELLNAQKEERRTDKKESLEQKRDALQAQINSIRANVAISDKNLEAADRQIEAAEKQLEAAGIDPEDTFSRSALRQASDEDLKAKLILAKGQLPPPPIPPLDRITGPQEIKPISEKSLRNFEAIQAEIARREKSPSGAGTADITDLQDQLRETEGKLAGFGQSVGDTSKDIRVANIGGDLDQAAKNAAGNIEIATNGLVEGLKGISSNLSSFSNLIAKEIAASEGIKKQALFQAATSADPSQILSGLTTARRESALQATGDPEAANQDQALLEKRLNLIKATSTAQRIEAEKEYEINLEIYRIRKEIDNSSSDEEIEAAALRIQELLSAPDTLREGLVKALAIDGKEASLNIKNTLIEGAVGFRDALIDGLMQAIQEGASLKDILLSAATDFLNKITSANLENAFGAIAGALGTATKGIGGSFTKGFASGGMIRGGSGMKDDIPALLMGGEYVMKKSSVQKYGQGFMEKVNNGDLPKFANGGLVDLFGFPLSPNERNRLESSSAYGNPLKTGKLPVQTGEGGFFGPGIFGGGAIKGRQDLLAFAGQSFTAGLSDRKIASRSEFGGVAGISLEPESVRLTRFGRTLGTPLQRATQEAKGQAFEAATIEQQERTRLKLEEKQRKKERKEAFKRAIIGAVVSTAFSAAAQSAGAGFSNAFSGAKESGAGIFSSLGSGLKGIFTGAPVAGSQENFGGLFNLFNGRGSLTGTNLIETIKTNPIDPIAQSFIKNNPDSPLAQAFSNRTPLKAVDVSGGLGGVSRATGFSSTSDLENRLSRRRATGGYIPNRAGVDTVPTMLSGGEFVLNSAATQRIGPANLERANAGLEELQRENSEDLIDKIEELIDIQKESTGGGDITITVNSTSSGQTQGETEDSAGASTKDQELARKIKEQVLLIINEEKRLGGTLRRI